MNRDQYINLVQELREFMLLPTLDISSFIKSTIGFSGVLVVRQWVMHSDVRKKNEH